MGRTIGSIILGFVVWTVLFLGGNALITALSPASFNPDGTTDSAGLLLLLLILSIVYSIVSGWITSRVAQGKSFVSCVALGVILLAVGIFAQLQYWDQMPLWYHLPFLAMLIPGVLIGHRLAGGGR